MDNLPDRFFSHLQDLHYSALTIKRYQGIVAEISHFLEMASFAEKVDWSAVSRSDLTAFLQRRSPEDRGHSAQTRNLELASLKTLFAYLLEEGVIGSNPAPRIDFAKESRKPPVYLSQKEYQGFLEVIHSTTSSPFLERNLAIAITLYNTGLRVSELVSLNVNMIDWEAREFRGVLIKGGEVVNVPFNSEVPETLKKWLKQREKMRVVQEELSLFVSRRGMRLSSRHIEELFAGYSHHWGKKKVTPHVLRHSMATELAVRGKDIKVISEILHHQSLNTTKIYLHLAEDSKRKALEALVLRRGKKRT